MSCTFWSQGRLWKGFYSFYHKKALPFAHSSGNSISLRSIFDLVLIFTNTFFRAGAHFRDRLIKYVFWWLAATSFLTSGGHLSIWASSWSLLCGWLCGCSCWWSNLLLNSTIFISDVRAMFNIYVCGLLLVLKEYWSNVYSDSWEPEVILPSLVISFVGTAVEGSSVVKSVVTAVV